MDAAGHAGATSWRGVRMSPGESMHIILLLEEVYVELGWLDERRSRIMSSRCS